MTIEKQLDIMCKLGIQAEDYFLIEILHISHEYNQMALAYKYFEFSDGKIHINYGRLNKLTELGILEPFDSSGPFFYESLQLTKKFKSKFFIEALIHGQELWDAFPIERSYRIDGRALLTRKIGKEFASLEDFFLWYGKQIRFSLPIHREVMAGLEIAKQQKQIDFTIEDFIKNKMWENFKEEQNAVKFI